MRYRFFTIPIADDGSMAEIVNSFLSVHRILSVERQFVQDGANSAWAFCIGHEAGEKSVNSVKRPRIDYREVFNDGDFAVFAKLRTLRKELAERDGVPAYAIFTNDQRAEMVQRRVRSKAGLTGLSGVGSGRVEKYGQSFLQVLAEVLPEERQPGSENGETQ